VIGVPTAVAVGDPFANPAKTNKTIREELADAVALVEFADLFRGQRSNIAEFGSVRIDVQGPWSAGDGNNIQAQLGKAGTIAAIRIAGSLGDAKGAINQQAVVGAAGNAILASCEDGMWRNLTGTEP
jgi:hypothetical protein